MQELTMAASQQNSPVLRFIDELGNQFPKWRQANLGDILSVRYGKEHKHLRDGDIPVLGTGGIIRYANSALYNQPSVLIGRKGTIDNPQFIEQPFWAVDTVFYSEISTSNVPYFVYLIVLRINWKRYNEATGLPSLNVNSINGIRVSIPSKPEQQKIADFLSSIDNRIEQLEKKKALFEQYKKGLMQKLFSQEIRFRDDQGKEYPGWEKEPLGNVAKFSKGKGISKGDVVSDGNVGCIRYGELYTHYGATASRVLSRTNLSIDQLEFGRTNDVLIPASGETALDIATVTCLTTENIALGGDINIIRSDQNGIFLAYYLISKKKDIARLAQGISVIHLYSTQLKMLVLNIPSKPEQQKIAKLLSSIDRKIEFLRETIDKTREFKKGLLQQMFV